MVLVLVRIAEKFIVFLLQCVVLYSDCMIVLPPPPPHLQNRPSVITCAPASNRNCNLSLCHMNGCSPSPPADQRKTNGESDERRRSTLNKSINQDRDLKSHFIW